MKLTLWAMTKNVASGKWMPQKNLKQCGLSIQEVRKHDFLQIKKIFLSVLSESQEAKYTYILVRYYKRKEKEEDIYFKTSSIKCILGVG